ncbi:transcription accessory protein [Candidatus Magnetomorum sp. HK-1]|nr:transcription accessory protein [Candidatus Magnetomorum sp. HK-1]
MDSYQHIEQQFIEEIASAASCQAHQILATDKLLAEGSTIPFIARYRKEATGSLLDEQLEIIAKQREYFIELAQRRDTILTSIEEQGKLTDELESAIRQARSKQVLEDLYLPYKPKRRTRAQIAREKGLEPLSEEIFNAASTDATPESFAEKFIDAEKGVENIEDALAGARDILAEMFAESVDNRTHLRKTMVRDANLESRVLMGQEEAGKDYQDYFEFSQIAFDVPSHRMLAILRGEREGFLISSIKIDDDTELVALKNNWDIPLESPCGLQVAEASADAYKRLLRPSITNEIRNELQEKSELEAISVFRNNLKALLMQSPFGQQTVMGLDPGFRTGCKMAIVGTTGQVLDSGVIYPVPPNEQINRSTKTIVQMVNKHNVCAIAIGNGTASRETEFFVKNVVKEQELKNTIVVIVPETGASVYSASQVAREEMPDLDVSIRGAVSIARRMQDPLAEFVKIEPRSLGVGQYQHDVNQKALEKELALSVEQAVNTVGVELNTASASLLKYISGLSERIAREIIKTRNEKGPFKTRKEVLKVKGLGPKTFEQAAGFLRIQGAKNVLDATAVHPERYGLVEKMAEILGSPLNELVGNQNAVKKINFDQFIDEEHGIGKYTLADIREELLKPGRDPRPEFKAPRWRDDIRTIEDLKEGMTLEGRVSNVANFGAFVDIGLKADGLVHISELSNQWVDDPQKVVQVGKIVKVMVKDIDHKRKRVGLSIKALQEGATQVNTKPGKKQKKGISKGMKNNAPTIQDLMNKFNRNK